MRFFSHTRYPPLLLFVMALCAFTAFGDEPRSQSETHEPFTFQGFRVRSNIAVPIPGIWGPRVVSMGPALFQEIAPCRFISTLEADDYPAPWGGPAFKKNESRSYQVIGFMGTGEWKNPCSYVVPGDALAVAVRIYVKEPDGDGTVYLAPAAWAPGAGLPILAFHEGDSLVEEGAMMIRGGGFTLSSFGAGADLTVDLLGYFIEDPDGAGPQGPQGPQGVAGPQGLKGDSGLPGPQGEIGPTGPLGPKGDQGLTGPQGEIGPVGPQGPKGDQGLAGPQGIQGLQGEIGPIGPPGPKGDQGIAGAQGIQGPQGEIGPIGPQGPTGLQGPIGPPGPKGDPGIAGAQGIQGLQGEIGPIGPQGPTGLQGPIGLTGAQGDAGAMGPAGPEGPIGPTGPQGLQGDPGVQGDVGPAGPQGDPGPTGPAGPTGPQGPIGPMGPAGPAGSIGGASGVLTFPPGGQITVFDSRVTDESLIIGWYVGGSLGNACSVDSQSNGSVTFSGSPNKSFRYIVIN